MFFVDFLLRRRRSVLVLLFVVLLFGGNACSRRQVVIGSPDQRYDHNRLLKVAILMEGSEGPFVLLGGENYAPLCQEEWPSIVIEESPDSVDGLAHAVLEPVFTGIALPLDNIENYRSDRADLLNYLASGPIALCGVDEPDATGDLEVAEREFRPLLDFLASAEALGGSRGDVVARLAGLGIKTRKVDILDSRFISGSFSDRLAVRFKEFWFILFKAPNQFAYSRLVVVPSSAR